MDLTINKTTVKSAIENFKKKETGDGKSGPFYNETQKWEFKVDDIELFKNAVWQGYLDTKRTCRAISKNKETNINSRAFLTLAKSIQAYFAKENAGFEHKDWCEAFIKNINKEYGYSMRYGQAQKVVNMAFKYLYCCDNIDEKTRKKFLKCHMPLDQYTLYWYFLKRERLYLEWSHLTYVQYKPIADDIRTIVGDDVLGAELIIWERMKSSVIDLREVNK